ncbi:MAG: DUF3540 domain-containing protein [Saccharospirillum sp.]|nr:DUF3540 domain-containing protein [Saccharospirillum sp.]
MRPSVVPMASPQQDCRMEEARVQSTEGGRVLLQTAAGIETGRRAVSCLVNPEPGDWVLLSRSQRTLYVLSVLERRENEQAEVTLGFSGPVKLTSPDQVTIRSQSAHWINQETQLSTRQLSVAATNLDAVSDKATLHSGTLRLISQSLDVISDRICRHARTLISMVRGQEVRQAHQLSEQVINTHLQQSKQTVVDARKDLRMNAERIHMG